MNETLQTLIETFLEHFEEKNIFNNISLPRLSKNMSITVQNMTESPNKISKLCPGIVKSLVLD